MTTAELVSTLRGRDIRIWADGDRLRFVSPAGGLDADLRDHLSTHKQELLAYLRQESEAALPRLVCVPRDGDALPLSFAQQRLWFIQQLQPGNVAYNLQQVVGFVGDLDVAALRAAIAEVVARHEILRTRFPVQDG